MKKNNLIYGLMAGVVVSIPMLYTANECATHEGAIDFDKGLIIGYTSMLIAFSMVYVGIRNYRDKYNGGFISFGKAFKTGMVIVLIASTIYVAAWLVDYFFFIPDFAEKYSAHVLDKLRTSGASQVEIAKETKDMAEFCRMYKNPFFNGMMAYVEILPVGILVTLISSFILKRKPANK